MTEQLLTEETATPQTPPSDDFQTLQANTQQIGSRAIALYNQYQDALEQIDKEHAYDREFAQKLGTNLDKVLEYFRPQPTNTPAGQSVTQQTTGAAVRADDLNKEQNFVLKIAAERPKQGFTMEELPALGQKAGLGDMADKNVRNPLLMAVLSLQERGLLKTFDKPRDGKTVYGLAQIQS